MQDVRTWLQRRKAARSARGVTRVPAIRQDAAQKSLGSTESKEYPPPTPPTEKRNDFRWLVNQRAQDNNPDPDPNPDPPFRAIPVILFACFFTLWLERLARSILKSSTLMGIFKSRTKNSKNVKKNTGTHTKKKQ